MSAHHVEAAVEGDNHDLDVLALPGIMPRDVGRNIEDGAYLDRVAVADLPFTKTGEWLPAVRRLFGASI